MEKKTNRCQIIRAGSVLRLGDAQAIILINGRPVPVPIEKMGDRIQIGDEVKWSGALWEKVSSES
ncbi:hypothetical protein AB6A23_12205 [Paenibacillus tarimensis]